ncbi:MAG: hypothetical protein AAF570_14330, partial [Bacteroidota bacterium]
KKERKIVAKGLGRGHRSFFINGKHKFEDFGAMAKFGETIYYIPSTTTQTPFSLVMDLISPVSFTKYMKTPGIPARELLPIHGLAAGILNSEAEDDDKERMLQKLALTHNGSIIHQDQKDENGDLYEMADKELKVVVKGSGF